MARDKGMLRSRACLLSSCSARFLYLPRTLMALQGFVVVCQFTVKARVCVVCLVVIAQHTIKNNGLYGFHSFQDTLELTLIQPLQEFPEDLENHKNQCVYCVLKSHDQTNHFYNVFVSWCANTQQKHLLFTVVLVVTSQNTVKTTVFIVFMVFRTLLQWLDECQFKSVLKTIKTITTIVLRCFREPRP
jgi:hypothetical protein